MLLVDDLAAGGTKNLRHTPRGLVTLTLATIFLNGAILVKGQTVSQGPLVLNYFQKGACI